MPSVVLLSKLVWSFDVNKRGKAYLFPREMVCVPADC